VNPFFHADVHFFGLDITFVCKNCLYKCLDRIYNHLMESLCAVKESSSETQLNLCSCRCAFHCIFIRCLIYHVFYFSEEPVYCEQAYGGGKIGHRVCPQVCIQTKHILTSVAWACAF
jgi:hypothetical protein